MPDGDLNAGLVSRASAVVLPGKHHDLVCQSVTSYRTGQRIEGGRRAGKLQPQAELESLESDMDSVLQAKSILGELNFLWTGHIRKRAANPLLIQYFQLIVLLICGRRRNGRLINER